MRGVLSAACLVLASGPDSMGQQGVRPTSGQTAATHDPSWEVPLPGMLVPPGGPDAAGCWTDGGTTCWESKLVGIGLNNPAYPLHVATTSQWAGVFQGVGSNSRGVFGTALAGTGVNYGGFFTTASTDGVGVFGKAAAGAGGCIGVKGESASSTGWAGYFQGRGYFANTLSVGNPFPNNMYMLSVTGPSLLTGPTTVNGPFEIQGNAPVMIGANFPAAPLTIGLATRIDENVTLGPSRSITGEFELGIQSQIGPLRLNANSGLVQVGGPGTADLFVTGVIAKGGGSFKIDHPLDPENKYLYHSFVESPDMKNVYDGVVTLDRAGRAVVELPEYFEALNRDYRYQLTCVGGFAPVYVASKVSGNRFVIAGGMQGLEVSWQVTGIRKDAFAERNRIPTSVDKPASERGRYLHPEAFGKSSAMSVFSKGRSKSRSTQGTQERGHE